MKRVKALIINYPNNPLGAVCDLGYMKHAVEFCKKHNILLMSDAAYVDVVFEGQPKAPSVFEVEGAKDIAVEFFSFSKPYSMTGWRIGWVCGNKDAVGVFAKLKSTIDNGAFKPMQKAASEVLNSEEGDKYIEEDGTVLVSKSSVEDSKFNNDLGTILGEEEHLLTKEELPKIDITTQWAHPSSSGGNGAGLQYGEGAGATENVLSYNTNYGENPVHNNIQPSKIVNRWHRTA